MATDKPVDQKTVNMKTGEQGDSLKVSVETMAPAKPEPKPKSLYTKPVMDALRAAHEHDEKKLPEVDGEVRKSFDTLGIIGPNGALNQKGASVAGALAAAGWKR